MRFVSTVAAASIVLLSAAALWAQTPDCSAAPGYTQHGPARTFTTDNLFEYMNGNSEGYFAYSFVKMNGVTCKKGAETLIIDISEFEDPEMAFGMFSANKDPKTAVDNIGTAGQVAPRKGVFVKGKYYVEAAAETDRDHTAELRAVLAAIEKKTPGETTKPAALGWFPSEGLEPGSVRLVPASVLGLRILEKGYVGQYGAAKAFVVAQASPEAAQAVVDKLHTRFGEMQKAGVGDEAWSGADKYLGRLCIFRKGKYVAGVANAAAGQDPVALAGQLAARIP